MYPAISLDLLFYILFTSVRSSSKVLWVYVPLVVSFFILCPIIRLIHTSFAPALSISNPKAEKNRGERRKCISKIAENGAESLG